MRLKIHPQLIVPTACVVLFVATLAAALGLPWKPSAPITVVGATRLGESNRVRLNVRNDSPNRVRLYAVDLWTRVGTNWALGGEVKLGFTNCIVRALDIDVDFPARPGPWRASLVYMPAFGHMKLLKYRLKDAWNAKSLSQGFMTTGWEGARNAYSPEVP